MCFKESGCKSYRIGHPILVGECRNSSICMNLMREVWAIDLTSEWPRSLYSSKILSIVSNSTKMASRTESLTPHISTP